MNGPIFISGFQVRAINGPYIPHICFIILRREEGVKIVNVSLLGQEFHSNRNSFDISQPLVKFLNKDPPKEHG